MDRQTLRSWNGHQSCGPSKQRIRLFEAGNGILRLCSCHLHTMSLLGVPCQDVASLQNASRYLSLAHATLLLCHRSQFLTHVMTTELFTLSLQSSPYSMLHLQEGSLLLILFRPRAVVTNFAEAGAMMPCCQISQPSQPHPVSRRPFQTAEWSPVSTSSLTSAGVTPSHP